jgi:protein TonB
MKSVQLKIINAVYYPQEAKDYGWEGTVNLILRITAEGNLKDVKILQSSGFKLLDDTAIETVKKQAPYPPFPPEVRFEELKVQVPIVYSKR